MKILVEIVKTYTCFSGLMFPKAIGMNLRRMKLRRKAFTLSTTIQWVQDTRFSEL